MLLGQATETSDFIAAFNLLTNGEETTPHFSAREPSRDNHFSSPGPELVASVAESAGLSRFVYIVGASKHRYVFSSIQKGQISLYSEAVFVVINGNNRSPLWVGNYSSLITHLNAAHARYAPRIYVHLLAEGEAAKSHVVSDLSGSPSGEKTSWKLSAA